MRLLLGTTAPAGPVSAATWTLSSASATAVPTSTSARWARTRATRGADQSAGTRTGRTSATAGLATQSAPMVFLSFLALNLT